MHSHDSHWQELYKLVAVLGTLPFLVLNCITAKTYLKNIVGDTFGSSLVYVFVDTNVNEFDYEEEMYPNKACRNHVQFYRYSLHCFLFCIQFWHGRIIC